MRLTISLVCAAILLSCAPVQPTIPDAHHVANGEFANAAAFVAEKRYQDAAEVYRKIAAEAQQSQLAGDAEFELAHLLICTDNPRKDYSLALSGFEDFLKHWPLHPKAADAENWRTVLRTLLDTKKENEHLNKSIEQLKKLDIRHEEKRGK
jgi:TolA-binding protein